VRTARDEPERRSIRLSQVTGQRVLTRKGAEQIGSVRRLLVDARAGLVAAAEVEGGIGEGTIVDWGDVASIGPDALIVESGDVARGPVSEIEQRLVAGELDLLGKQVLDEAGTSLGPLEDIEFDARSGRLSSLAVPGHSLPLDRLVAVGPDAVIVPLPAGGLVDDATPRGDEPRVPEPPSEEAPPPEPLAAAEPTGTEEAAPAGQIER
jgi:sporulation protein YlmC with PRC-barrel domain